MEKDKSHHSLCWIICKWLIKRHPEILEECFIESNSQPKLFEQIEKEMDEAETQTTECKKRFDNSVRRSNT